ncbi:helix-turn-helix domain-containing protein [Spirosoma arcticum]
MDYSRHITESVSELKQLETRQKLARDRDRVRFLRLLKEKTASSQGQAGETINLAQRQSQRLWQTYTQFGICGLIGQPHQPGFGKLSATQISQLQAWLRLDQAQTLTHIQTYVQQRWAITYSISGLSRLCNRLKIKTKTGRPVNRRQKPWDAEVFKKTSLN